MRSLALVLCASSVCAQTQFRVLTKPDEGLYIQDLGKTLSMVSSWVLTLDTSTGQYVATQIQPMTITYNGPSNTTGTVRVEISDNPITTRCLVDTLPLSNFSTSGCSLVQQSQFSAKSIPVGQSHIIGGQWQFPQPYLTKRGMVNYQFRRGLRSTGGQVFIDEILVPTKDQPSDWTAKQTMPGVQLKALTQTPVDGDIWYEAGRSKCQENGVTQNCSGTQARGTIFRQLVTGDEPSLTLLAAPHESSLYRVCGTVSVTSGSGAFTPWTLTWKDLTDITRQFAWDDNGTMTSTPSISTGNSLSMCRVISSSGSSPITINPGNAGSASYDMFFRIENIR